MIMPRDRCRTHQNRKNPNIPSRLTRTHNPPKEQDQMETINIAVVGAGIIGLAVAAKISEHNQGIYVFEKNERFGQETSSHNSGVIHSGIHYPHGSLKAKLCVKGNPMLYTICQNNHIPHKKLGKLTVALNEEETKELEHLMKQGQDNGVPDLQFLDGDEAKKLEPNIQVEKALSSPSTGILEPDELMHYYHAQLHKTGTIIAYKTEVTSINKTNNGYELSGTSVGERFAANARTVINCAGLHSDKIAQMTGLGIDKLGYRLHHCKGDYYRMKGPPPVTTLVYPLPKGGGLGIHLTPDMTGSVRLGPNAYYVDKIDYEVASTEDEFRQDVARFLPLISNRELAPDSAGVRPKLQGPNDSFKDFVIRHEADKGLSGFVNLIGIESPGLTAAPAIAEFVEEVFNTQIR